MSSRIAIIKRVTSRELERLRRYAVCQMHRFRSVTSVLNSILGTLTFVSAIAFFVLALVYIGFDHELKSELNLIKAVRAIELIFFVNVIVSLVLNFGRYLRERHWSRWLVDALMVLAFVLSIGAHSPHTHLTWWMTVLYNKWVIYGLVASYAAIVVSAGISRMLGKHTNPSLMLSGSFLIIIILGAFVLMMPKCTQTNLTFIDSLFLSTSAVCITGLTPVDVSATLTPLGLTVLGILIEVGAMGVLTFTCFFALFFTGTSSIYNQLMLRDVIYSKSMSDLVPTMLYILFYTVFVEAVGALLIWLTIHGKLGVSVIDEATFAVFHAVSAFCNAGFSNVEGGLSNPRLLYGTQSFYWVISALVICGSMGFPLLINLKSAIGKVVRRRFHGRAPKPFKTIHLYDMNTKIVLVTYSILFVAGAVAFFLLERRTLLADFDLSGQITQSVFNSVTPRSAGFSSLAPASFSAPTLMLVMFLMWIGGASQSTGGGIKVNAFAAVLLNLRAIVRGRKSVTAFRRTVEPSSIRRANAVVAFSIIGYVGLTILLMLLEPEISPKEICFEMCSALFTVGSSIGATPQLGYVSKMIVCLAMFVGRVGIVSLLMGLVGRHSAAPVRYPSDSIIIN